MNGSATTLLVLLAALGCGEPTVLRVALYPYIPDAAADGYRGLLQRIEAEFEGRHPSVDLRLASLDPTSGASYDLDSLRSMLTLPISAGGFHLVEVDAALLGDLADGGLVRPWSDPPGRADWHPAAVAAVTLDGGTFGVPHWLCSHFLFSREPSITAAASAEQLAAALRRTTPGTPGLAAKFAGDWDLTALYLDAWVDTYGEVSADAALPPADSVVLQGLRAVVGACRAGEGNPCLAGGPYGASAETAARAFAERRVDAFIGFSEHLHPMLQRARGDRGISLAAAPLGRGRRPVVFVDALVLRRGCDRRCEAAARTFAAYLNQPETHEWIAMAGDAGPAAIPRYLMPAPLSAYRQPSLAADPYYPAILAATTGAIPFPNRGMAARWGEARRRLDSLLSGATR
jgi:thiamine pyridinylase